MTTTLENARQRLLSELGGGDHWEGRLSSSALATAIASFALLLAGSRDDAERGFDWLARHQNEDGGFGDSPESPSNLPATLLCWSAFAALPDAAASSTAAAGRAAAWLTEQAGGLEPELLREAVLAAYGQDRTFSAPILTMCALSGTLGDERNAWRLVPRLPFELAALPQGLYRWLGMPVVSYALPALIAVGLVRQRRGPRGVSPAVFLRAAAVGKVLRLLRRIQPASGGFLEAAPLTGFVCMSLIGSGLPDHAVTSGCVGFLRANQRDDGSWPIDTNLSVWLTSQAALALGGDLEPGVRRRALDYLLAAQSQQVHPFTGASQGGWPWTHLPGGVPDADDTSAALIAVSRLTTATDEIRGVVRAGATWLLNLQNRDGGVPTFCRGWGKLPFDRSCPDITANAIVALETWREELAPWFGRRIDRFKERAIRFLAQTQRANGSWIPLWFGNQAASDRRNPTYGTARVVDALRLLEQDRNAATGPLLDEGLKWLRGAQNPDGGWGGDRGLTSTIEETAVAVHALAAEGGDVAVTLGVSWLSDATSNGSDFPAAPIGLYFASLWYSERLYPLIFTVAALERAARVELATGSN